LWSHDGEELLEFPVVPPGHSPRFFDQASNLVCIPFTTSANIIRIDTLGATTIIPRTDFSAVRNIQAFGPQEIAIIAYAFSDRTYKIFVLNIFDEWIEVRSEHLIENLDGWMYSDTIGQLWVGYQNDLLRYNDNELTKFEFTEEEIPGNIIGMHKDKYGHYWMATDSAGIVRWDQETVHVFNTSNGLTANTCFNLEIINGEELWVNHRHGLSKMKIDSLYIPPPPQDTTALQYTLYPNPSSGHVSLTNPISVERSIDVYTVGGALVSSHISDIKVWTTTLETGVYVLIITEGETQTIEKLVVL